ncbi:MAG TPA: alpha-amylase family glycosyl hydrolase [Geobacteraceae bacterium]|nr:alpha-amylase family glycosyl hydrolase [Geobacteraceae bacterium]
MNWPHYPVIYEINTWVWLRELGKGEKKPVTLATVPAKEWDAIASFGFDAVWLMGVWERSPAGIQVAMGNQGLLADFRRALPDFAEADNVGSPYCVRNYAVDPHLGGPEGLAKARKELAKRGLRLILDFVPNHVAPDHPWVSDHPDYFIRGDYGDSVREPAAYITEGGHVFACGRDPYFPAWPDVLQLNAFNEGLRAAVIETVNSIADQCDGVRCDMAMLVMNDIFQRTWGERGGTRPTGEYWPGVIGAVRRAHPEFLFMAEAYWDLEWELQQQGFDYCYDKKLYDRLEHGSAESVRLHLCADLAYQERLVRFIENHDEPRAAATFSPEKERAAVLLTATLPGAVLLHEGQFEGRKVRLPVFLGRRPDEPPDAGLREFYATLLGAIAKEGVRKGAWRLCEREGWPDNQSCLNIVAWSWESKNAHHLIIVNLGDGAAQARVRVPGERIRGLSWRLIDLLNGETWDRDGDEMGGGGLYVDLGPWGCNFFRLQPL